MIQLTDTNGRTHAIHLDAIARLVEPGSSGKCHGANCYVRTFDGDTIEVRESVSEIMQMLGASIPEGWLRAIDEALVVANIGVANASDTYEQAREKLDNLIGFHVDVATDPAVNGGWKLVPIEPTETFYQCFSAYDGTPYSNPFDYDDFVKDWRAMLATTPEAKP